MFKTPLINKISEFIRETGLEIVPAKLDENTFLSGIFIENGKIFVDENKLTFPGDLLHEAGHLAVAPESLRGQLGDEVFLPDFDMDALEAAAIAWSYAAALHLDLNPRVVFHEGGYKGKAESLLHGFSIGVFIGVNILEKSGMTATGERAEKLGISPYPKMIKWLAD
ncbi:MAG: hypothetical protein WA584_01305 [Pyrinomonadaceae bacterium]